MYMYTHTHGYRKGESKAYIKKKKLKTQVFETLTQKAELQPPSLSLISKISRSNSEGGLNPVKFFMRFNCVSKKNLKSWEKR